MNLMWNSFEQHRSWNTTVRWQEFSLIKVNYATMFSSFGNKVCKGRAAGMNGDKIWFMLACAICITEKRSLRSTNCSSSCTPRTQWLWDLTIVVAAVPNVVAARAIMPSLQNVVAPPLLVFYSPSGITLQQAPVILNLDSSEQLPLDQPKTDLDGAHWRCQAGSKHKPAWDFWPPLELWLCRRYYGR